MTHFSSLTTTAELKRHYRKLACQFHPDRGGDVHAMQAINSEYQATLNRLQNKKRFTQFCNFKHIAVGDTLYVNGTEAEVIEVHHTTFRAVAKGRSRQAVFDKNTGYGKYNRRLRASMENIDWREFSH